MLLSNMEATFTRTVLRGEKGNVLAKIKSIHAKDKNFNKTTVAKELNISRKTLYNYLKEIK